MKEHSSVFLDREDWPEWFTLDLIQGLDPTVLPGLPLQTPLLILGIAEGPLKRLVDDLQKYSMVDNYKKHLKKYDIEADFLLDIDKPWGFGGVLNPHRRTGRDDGQRIIEYSIAIPRIEKDAGECGDCNGTAKVDDRDCFHCMGTGRDKTNDLDVLNCISATLCVLTVILDMPDKELVAGIKTKRQQLLTVQMHFGRWGAAIGATLSRPFGDYLRLLSGQELSEAKAAIKSVYLQMFPGYARFGDFDYRANVHRNGQLIIDVPGDGCGLYVDGCSKSLQEASGPMRLNCHNVDGHHQQLALLCGLAAISGMARKSLYSNADMT